MREFIYSYEVEIQKKKNIIAHSVYKDSWVQDKHRENSNKHKAEHAETEI